MHIKSLIRTFLFFLFIPLLSMLSYATPSLEGYLSRDITLKTLALEVNKALLSEKSSKLDNNFNITLSTGKITIYNTKGDYAVHINPSLTASVPLLSNLTLSSSSSIKAENKDSPLEDTKLTLGVDIISSTLLTRKLSLMSSSRTVLVAKRALKNQGLTCEKEFYSQLKALFSSYESIIKLEKTLYDDKIELESTRVKGFSVSSPKYRLALMKVQTGEHDIEIKSRKLKLDCSVFATKCDDTYTPDTDIKEYLPSTIKEVTLLDIESFNKECYTKIENAKYTHAYNDLKRRADKNFSLAIGGGYTFNNSAINKDTVDVTLTTGIKGIDITGGVSLPVENITQPVYTASLGLNPTAIVKKSISNKTGALNREGELLEIDKAYNDYQDSINEKKELYSSLLWEHKTDSENYTLYSELEKDMKDAFDKGVISESEYLSSSINKEEARIALLLNAIDLIIYNDDVSLLFYTDE